MASAATIAVNSASDPGANSDGSCTLREAINSVNAGAVGSTGCTNTGGAFGTADEIDFGIPGDPGTVQTIAPTTALPALAMPVFINGYTQGDASPNTLAVGTDAKLRIEIDASGVANDLLRIDTDGATIRGLVMNHLTGKGLYISLHNNNTFAGNYINTDPTGNTFVGATNAGVPVVAWGNSNHVGGTDPADRNVIGPAVFNGPIVGITGTGNVVQGNYINVSADGTSVLQPVANNADSGIYLYNNGPAYDTLIGGTTAGAGNVIAGSTIGISLRYDDASADHPNVIQGNRLGTDATGSYALSSGGAGIQIVLSSNTTIGGADGAGNLISGYATGITTYSDEPGTVIQGNRIGTDSTGAGAIPNTSAGIYITTPGFDMSSPVQSMVGGNTIAHNCGAGIAFGNNASYNRWPISGNSIYSNGGLGIDLGPSANNQQAYPVITSAPVSSGSVNISGTLDSLPTAAFHLEFFSGIGCHPTGYGEGRYFLGSMNAVMTAANGHASFTSPMFSVPTGHSVFTATARDPDGNTSEFSQCFGTPDLLFGNGFDSCSASD